MREILPAKLIFRMTRPFGGLAWWRQRTDRCGFSDWNGKKKNHTQIHCQYTTWTAVALRKIFARFLADFCE